MRNLKFLATAIFATVLFVSCSNDDDTPEEVNEEEVITTLTVTLTPDGGGTPVTLQTRDLDGDGPDAPVITTGNLAAGVTYNGSIVLLNETETPAENITLEVEEEDDEHQFFYTIGGGLDVTTAYANFDGDGNPLGTQFTLTAGAVSSGTLTFTLRHEPMKPNTGLGDAGGETDIAASFNVMVQ
ncbi:type 1 periplasmic binding fold superfamily protein [Subsaximicrobium wynnwilliamsii]|uniref:Type 1 periplasmic binding fold superfamily protein n=1 Tax=Subsaximicrobium wynnwilliamsii TaxID=291179 RepID=A0A5C6ZKR2_9FLAO|nr:type 1 periplasmic binding fold superfamily protein [Subsaximicrobium wynnwilliamsii]TXD84513.1 type 1 periplasmic binding fold superfamily protein [Subsaximicrobium wynnwilliamsii]TXD90195.1 type 1 periplasmic binding fold superfamily protein [Subsaximicrobium wynnwilliamsii]TXE04246.1 type 1 periplasmic binding fold superfamily protein [Subsaximicrobium wynnwilliamsii]